jgi:hypothetical protein
MGGCVHADAVDGSEGGHDDRAGTSAAGDAKAPAISLQQIAPDIGQYMVPLPYADTSTLGTEACSQFVWPDEPEARWRTDIPLLDKHRQLVLWNTIVPQFAPGSVFALCRAGHRCNHVGVCTSVVAPLTPC